MTKVFLDANVYFAGFLSSQGASALVLQLARRKKIQVIATQLVLHEADRNLRKKTSPQTLKSFHRFLQETKIQIQPAVDDKSLRKYESLIHPKDVPVIAAAVEAKADYLITLDRRHFLTEKIQSEVKRIKMITPGDFIRELFS